MCIMNDGILDTMYSMFRGVFRDFFHRVLLLFYEMVYYLFFSISRITVPLPELPPGTMYICIIILSIISFVYIKISYPFWNIQPVFHPYDFWRYYTRVPFTIQKSRPLITKFCQLNRVRTVPYSECSLEDKKNVIDLIQCHWISSDRIIMDIRQKQMDAYLGGIDGPSMVSFYEDIQYIHTTTNAGNQNGIASPRIPLSNDLKINAKKYPIGCMVSKQVRIMWNNGSIQAFYWDFICIHREHIKKNISRVLIQTHEYQQRIQHPEISVSIFKKEIHLCSGIVPLTQYMSYTYYIRNIPIQKLPPHVEVIRIYLENKELLFDLFNSTTFSRIFMFSSIPSISNILSLISSQSLYVYCLRRADVIHGFYFLKDTFTMYEDIENMGGNGHALQLIGSVHLFNQEQIGYQELFTLGFKHTLRIMSKQSHKKFQMVIIENISHNNYILSDWNRNFSPIFENPCAYYLYNMVFPGSPLNGKNCLCLL